MPVRSWRCMAQISVSRKRRPAAGRGGGGDAGGYAIARHPEGHGERTRVRVFDHHPLRRNTPAEWEVTVFDLGATTTFLVEALHERGALFTPLQATLLLLGIYEDTGSLTYSRTTARDARAVAWLLEQGADLGLAVRFLNPPLSPEQREFYDRLVAAAETHEINGHRVVLACGEAQHLTEEISSLAHKLRDLFEPDALFVLAQTGKESAWWRVPPPMTLTSRPLLPDLAGAATTGRRQRSSNITR